MEIRELGKSGLKTPALGLGCMGMSEFYGQHDDQSSIGVIHHAIKIGINFLDTADMYGCGHNEELVGRAIRGRRSEVILATKFGNVRAPDGRFLGVCGRPDYVKSACEASLKRLGIETIDLYYQHRVDPDTPIQETIGAMTELIREGKVRYLGMSEAAPATIRKAAAVHPIAALQTEYSLWTRDPEGEVLSTCRELGIGFVPYSPLGRGFLTGTINSSNDLMDKDWRKDSPRFQDENLKQNLKLAKRIQEIAAAKGCTAAQLALAWLLAQGKDIVPIPGTKRITYLEQNAAAVSLKLTEDELREISNACPPGAAAGTRYPEYGMKAVNR